MTDHRESALISISVIEEHAAYLLALTRYLNQTGERAMALQIVEDFTAAMDRIFAAHDAKHAESQESAKAADDASQHLLFREAELTSVKQALADEQAKSAELEKAMSEAIAVVNSRVPASA